MDPKGAIVVPIYFATSMFQNSYYSYSTLNFTPLEIHSSPQIKNLNIRETNKVELPLGIYIHPLQTPNENLRKSTSSITNVLHFGT
jgi:hypothetical protein